MAIVFIDLHRHHELIDKYAIRVISTLVFCDQNDNEAERHIGFMDKKSIEAEMARLGFEWLSVDKLPIAALQQKVQVLT